VCYSSYRFVTLLCSAVSIKTESIEEKGRDKKKKCLWCLLCTCSKISVAPCPNQMHVYVVLHMSW